jgi:GTP-binding protein HflX
VSHEDSDAQSQDVAKILDELGLKIEDESKIIEVWNKIDALTGDELSALQLTAQGYGAGRRPMLVSSLTGLGLDELLTHIEKLLFKNRATLTLVVPPEDGEGLAWLYANTEVISRNNRKTGATKLTIRVGPERYDAVKKRFDCIEDVISES